MGGGCQGGWEFFSSFTVFFEGFPNVKKEAGSLLHAETPYDNSRGSQSVCEEGTIYTPFDINIKVELDDTISLDDTIYSTASFGTEANCADLNDLIDYALRSNTDKFTSPDEILACEQKSDLFLHRHDGEPAENTNDKEFSTMPM